MFRWRNMFCHYDPTLRLRPISLNHLATPDWLTDKDQDLARYLGRSSIVFRWKWPSPVGLMAFHKWHQCASDWSATCSRSDQFQPDSLPPSQSVQFAKSTAIRAILLGKKLKTKTFIIIETDSVFKYEKFPPNNGNGVVRSVASAGFPTAVRRSRMGLWWMDRLFGRSFGGNFGFAWNPRTASRSRRRGSRSQSRIGYSTFMTTACLSQTGNCNNTTILFSCQKCLSKIP